LILSSDILPVLPSGLCISRITTKIFYACLSHAPRFSHSNMYNIKWGIKQWILDIPVVLPLRWWTEKNKFKIFPQMFEEDDRKIISVRWSSFRSCWLSEQPADNLEQFRQRRLIRVCVTVWCVRRLCSSHCPVFCFLLQVEPYFEDSQNCRFIWYVSILVAY
jgi:hypothetical protein